MTGHGKQTFLKSLIHAHEENGIPYNIEHLESMSRRQMKKMRVKLTGREYLRGKHA